ncbi:M20/M25/M40 family metallo-hydrolase [Lacihabitans sp. LS3-19]|uniref:M20/M25/M40 family metallo-hydrolase n=1 Tax=Lacihabitans sp. LS3-19 TaxID=2487335 RepID=UPI0020CD376D|nr:M20/M25/M40 family metallo-hydrolase [Lacihabitans sp. LS3-19]MCP9769601.1 M20/M25/M40 family metallo-hydrolase [Lacihabitans sp. LS3-19]
MKTLKFYLFLILFSGSLFAQEIPSDVLKLSENIDTNRIKAHVTYLASDALLGRKPGKPGYQMAVDYVVKEYKSMGILPAGENREYTQKVVLRNSKLIKENTSLSFVEADGSKKALVLGEDYLIAPNPENPSVIFKSPLVFVGSGIDAPELGFNDYKGIDVKGKICVVLQKSPDNVPANVKLHLRYPSTYQDYAMKHGAIGVLLCNYENNTARFKVGANLSIQGGNNVSIKPNGKIVPSASLQGGKIQVAGNITVDVLKDLMIANNLNLEEIWKSLEKGSFVSQNLKTMAVGAYESTYKDIESYNVIGKIEGSDKKLKKEYVIHSAHLDHLGVGKPIDGDSIYNGAHDNASGVAAALEIARTYSQLPVKPKRSMLFLMCTAEEMGLLGSAYFANNPTVHKKDIVVDVNTDMPTFLAQLESIAPLGAEHSTLMNIAEKAAKTLNLSVESDPEPTEGRFVRSDQYSFVKAGIPALHVKFGHINSNKNLAEDVKKWRATHYHKPSDQIENGFVWSASRKYAQVNFLISYMAAQDKNRVAWKKDDFFYLRLKK